MLIRSEEADYPGVCEVNKLAFGRDNEAKLVEDIRQTENYVPELSLVAVEQGQVIGHILFSEITIRTDERDIPILGLAPMAVRPEFQGKGIGSRLVEEGLRACRASAYGIVVVLGHPGFYPKFGFLPARPRGILAPFSMPDEVFMVLELKESALNEIKGTVHYPSVFNNV